ncbi:MAG TPA: inositol monophosphatase [Erysipelothrix sp.]|nr:inositol monophosphatase [Erysipelothrix sp.]
METRLNQTKKLVYETSALILDLLKNNLEIEAKSEKDWVTNIDKEAEKFLVKNLLKLYPNASFLLEEDTVQFKMKDELFVIDPIDGTSNLIHQKEYFGISVAYFYKKEPVFGIVLDVMADKMYVGVKNKGATLNEKPMNKLDNNTRVDNSILLGNITRDGLFKVSLKEILDTIPTYRYLGSGALDTCKVAQGHASAYVFPEIKAWDIAASLIILNEVGGTFSLGGHIDTFIFDDNSYPLMACANETVLNKLMSWT